MSNLKLRWNSWLWSERLHGRQMMIGNLKLQVGVGIGECDSWLIAWNAGRLRGRDGAQQSRATAPAKQHV